MRLQRPILVQCTQGKDKDRKFIAVKNNATYRVIMDRWKEDNSRPFPMPPDSPVFTHPKEFHCTVLKRAEPK
jgi:hypothetical protein